MASASEMFRICAPERVRSTSSGPAPAPSPGRFWFASRKSCQSHSHSQAQAQPTATDLEMSGINPFAIIIQRDTWYNFVPKSCQVLKIECIFDHSLMDTPRRV